MKQQNTDRRQRPVLPSGPASATMPAMTANPTNTLALLALLAVLAAVAAWPPAQAAGRFAFDRVAGAYQAIYLDSQSFRFFCM